MSLSSAPGGASTDPRADEWVLAVPLSASANPADALSSAAGPAAELSGEGACRVLFAGFLYGDDRRDVPAARRVLEAYRRHGEAALGRLRGRFTAVVWDGERELLLCARDPMGIHPLFWAEEGGHLYVSPSFAALRRRPGISDELDRAVVAEYMCYRFVDCQETVIRAIRRVPPGHVLRVSRGRRDVRRYWQPAPERPEDWVTEERLEEFDELFASAIDRFLECGRAGIFLSGGLDSVSVAAIARSRSAIAGLGPPWALSLAFPGPAANEEEVQRGVAAQLGLPQVMLGLEEAVEPRGVIGAAVDLSRRSPTPLTNYWLPAYERLAHAGTERGCRVILTGTGGDEWLGVTPYYAADLLRRGDVRGMARLWANLQRSYPVPRLVMARNLLWRFGARDLVAAGAVRALSRIAPRVLRRRRLQRIDARTPSWVAPDAGLRRALDERALAAAREPVTRRLYWREMQEALDHPLTSIEVEETYESGRRGGAPILQPFWDADLVQFLVRTPPELLNRGGRSKGVVRDMVARQVPGFGFERQRKVSASSVATGTVIGSALQTWRELDGVPCLGGLGVVHPDRLESELKRIVAEQDARNAYRLWYVFTMEAWLQSGS